MLIPYLRRLYLCSAIEGSLKLDDQPLKGAEVTRVSRSSYFDRKPITESVITDGNGDFKFEKRIKIPLIALFHQPAITQQISVRYKHKDLKSIQIYKGNYDKNGEAKNLVHDYNLKFDKDLKLEVNNGKLQLDFNLFETESKIFIGGQPY